MGVLKNSGQEFLIKIFIRFEVFCHSFALMNFSAALRRE